VKEDGGERNGDERGGENRGGVHQRQAGQRGEVEEHAGDADEAAGEMAQRPPGPHRRADLAAPSIDHLPE
jgi:hypothetical protein